MATVVVSALTTGCMRYEKPKTDTATSGTTTMVCDNSFQRIMEQEINVFEFQYPEAHILCRYEPQRVALDSLMSLNTRTIVITRDLTKAEVQKLKDKKRIAKSKKIAVDAIALIVNPSNPTNILSLGEIGDILTGKITDWNQIEPNGSGKVQVVFDNNASSLVDYMRDSLMNGKEFGPDIHAQNTIGEVFDAVKTHKGAIGVVGVSWLSTDLDTRQMSDEQLNNLLDAEAVTEGADLDPAVKTLKVRRDDSLEAYKPYQQYIYSGEYPLFRQVYMITVGANGGLAHGFYSFVTGPIGQKIILKSGILPAVIRPRIVEITN